MNLLFYAGSSGTIASGYRRTAVVLLRRAGRLIDNWVAATIARREREVVKAMLHRFSDRELKDIASVAARSISRCLTNTRNKAGVRPIPERATDPLKTAASQNCGISRTM